MFAVLQAFFLLLSSVTQESSGQQNEILNLQAEIHAKVDLPCSCSPNGPSSVLWYRINNTDDFVEDDRAIAWRGGGLTGYSPGYGINDDFSMAIHNVNLTSQGLYRCIVTAGHGAKSKCDVSLDVYANTYSPPLIEYSRETNEIMVTCSISHVFPPTFPKLTSYEGNGITEINEDGTYNTSVSHLFLVSNNDTTIQCLYSSANFKSMSSLLIMDCAGQPANKDKVLPNCPESNLNTRCTLSARRAILAVMFILEALILITIVLLIQTVRRLSARDHDSKMVRINVQNGHDDRSEDGRMNRNVETAVNPAIFLLRGKLFFGVVALSIQVTIMIISIIAIALCA